MGHIEEHFSLAEVAVQTKLTVDTLRKKAQRREFAYRKTGKKLLVPKSEVIRLMGKLRPAIQ